MGSVIVGTNRIANCQTLIGVKDHPLLGLSFSPLRVSLRLPANLPSKIFFQILDNTISGEGNTTKAGLVVVSGETNVSIFWRDMLLVSATALDHETVHLKLDLRPIGIQIFDDLDGLHIGKNILARSTFTNCMTAISLC